MLRRTTSHRIQVIQSLRDKEYRDLYVEEHIDQGLAFQIRATRDDRGWTQAELAAHIGSGQSAVSKLEDPDYGRQSMTTLKKLASAFDVALMVRLVPFSQLVNYTSDLSPTDLAPPGFEDDTALKTSELSWVGTTAARSTSVGSTGKRDLVTTSQVPLALDDRSIIPLRTYTNRTHTTPEIGDRDELRAAGGYR